MFKTIAIYLPTALIIIGSLAVCAEQPPSDEPLTVAQDGSGDFNGADEKPIIEAIDALGDDGGTVHIKPGEYFVRRKIVPKSHVTITGKPDTVLRLPPPTTIAAAADRGDAVVRVTDATYFTANSSLQIYPPPQQETFEDSKLKELEATIGKIDGDRLHLDGSLPCAVPQNSRIGYPNNVFELRKPKKNVTIEGLVIDGGRKKGILMPGHVDRCAILAHAVYSYEKGPTGPPIKNLRVVNCRIRNCYGRAVAMYSVVHSLVKACFITGIADEAIDFDHFCYHCRAVGNEVRNAVTGVTINDGSYCTVEYNRLTHCERGVNIWWWHKCPMEGIDVENIIRYNFIFAPDGPAISVGERCFRNRIVSNFVEGDITVAEPDNVVENNTRL